MQDQSITDSRRSCVCIGGFLGVEERIPIVYLHALRRIGAHMSFLGGNQPFSRHPLDAIPKRCVLPLEQIVPFCRGEVPVPYLPITYCLAPNVAQEYEYLITSRLGTTFKLPVPAL